MTTEEKPEDWIYNAVPRSKRESVAKDAEARVTETVKNAVATHLGRYLDSNGVYRKLLNVTAGFSVQFDTRLRGPEDPLDPSVYDVQLARFWGELRQKLPCILVVDTGFEYVNAGLGGLVNSDKISTNLSSVQMSMQASVPIELKIAALDEATCGDIRDLLVYILGPLSHLTKSHLIRSTRNEDKWEVRMPLTFTPSGLAHKAITTDTKDQMWTTSISITPVFEGLIRVGFANQLHPDLIDVESEYNSRVPLGFRMETGQLVPLSTAPSIDTSIVVPSSVALGQQGAPIEVNWIPAYSYFTSTDPRVALIDPASCTIIPKRLGSFKVKLVQKTPGSTKGPKILFTWDVEVVHS